MTTRRTTLGLAASLCLVPRLLHAQAAGPGLGLAERRAIAAYQQDKWPAIQAGIQGAAGFPVPVDVEWDQLAIPGYAKNYAEDEFFGKTIFEPLTSALRSITADQMGRDALKTKLQRIHVRFDEATAPASNYPNGIKFEGGVLDINWRPFSNAANVKPRTDALTDLLEKNL